MPFRDLGFNASRAVGGGVRCRLSFGGRTLVTLDGAMRAAPVHMAGNVAVLHAARRGRPAALAWPSTLSAAWTPAGGDHSAVGIQRLSGARWRAAPTFPALLEYRGGFCALATRDEAGETFLVAAGSPAAVLALDDAVAAALPEDLLAFLRREGAAMRLVFAKSMSGTAATPGAVAALNYLRDSAGAECLAGRGEFGDAFIWSFREPARRARKGAPRFAVAGVTAPGETLTLQFPFLPDGARFRAEWTDDAQDYYVRDGLEIRPETVTAATKAVVKTLPGGGFLVRLR